ncbi:fibronectin-like [Strongylocentrotus purpuratus]|uniref:Fibronectin type-III domain-containing protein n=1 Tax=Strongylocentrotus purpuratus TaxID=7668 RepID=A0A7M7T148_STRPU|nr:fibronectin-like [Strongylocentrotus purpuratus]
MFGVVAVNSDDQGGTPVENAGINIPACQLCTSSDNVGSNFFQLIFPATGVNTILSGRTVDASTELTVAPRAIGPQLTSIFYLGLQGGLLYELQMTDSNTQAIVYSSRHRTVPNPATNLLLSPDSSTSVQVTYEQPIGTQYHKYDGFRITYGDQERFVGSSDTSVVIDGLQAGISYTFEVQTFSGELADRTYSNPATGDIVLVDLFLEANATTSLSVAWALPSIVGSGFQIRYSILGASSFTTLPFGPTVTTATLENLDPGQIYRINLYIVTAGGTDLLAGAEFQTIPDVVSDILGETMDTSIALSWTPPPGKADYYLVMYDPDYGSTNFLSEASNPEFNIEGLDPGIEYEVSIISVAGSARSSAASETFMTDLGDTSLIRLKEISATSLSVTWSPNQFATTYTVSISPTGGNPAFPVSATSRLFAEFAGLSEGTLYTVTLVATPSSIPSLTADFKTNPSPPGPISPSNVLPRSATLSWGASSGADEYSFTVSSGENVIVEMRTADLSVDLTELEPETLYSVVIFAESTQQGLTSQSGEQSVDFETLPAVISLGTITTTSVRVLGTSDTQRIEYTPSDGSFISGSQGDEGMTILEDLTPGQEYTITITVNSANVDQVTFFTYPEVPQGVGLTLGDPDTSSVLVEYDAPSSGLYDGYLITYAGESVGFDGNEPSPITAEASSTQTTITGLTPGTVYTVNVVSTVNDGTTISSRTTRSITTERGADASFYVFSKTTNSIIIKFAQIGGTNTATATEQNGPVTNGDETTGQFTFLNLTPGTVYDVTLRISRAGQSAVTTSQMVQTLPNTPTSVAAVSSDESPAITVTWQPVDGGVSSYRLRLIPPAGGAETSLLIIAGLDTSYVFDNVQPSTEYDVTVTAVARDEALEEESYPATVQVTTDPRTFTFTSLTTTSFVLSFEAVADALIYEIYDGIHDDSQQFPTLPYQSLTDYQPGSLLQVTVFALTSSGGTLLVGSQDVLLKPEQVSDFSLTATIDTLTVSGINPGNGLVDIIEIEYGTEGIAYILPSVSEKKIEFLQQSTSYPVRVYAVVYAGGLSQRSDVREKSTFTLTGLRASPVVTEITANTIAISWTEFTPYTHHIFIQEKDTDVILEEASYVTADRTTTHTFNVQPATLYQVTIEAISSGEIIIETNLKDVRSLPEAVTFAQMTSVDLTSIALIWDIPDNARSDGFEVRVLPPPSPGNYPIIVNDQVYTVRSLRPGTVYDIQVLSLSGQADNCQTFGTPFEIVTTTESLDVLEIVAVDIYDTRASVEFSATNLMLQDVNEYEIAVTPSAGGMAQIITVTKGIYTADITDLIGGTSYDVLLSAVLLNSEKDNDTATTTFVTLPKAPVSVTEVSAGFFSFTVELEPPVNSSYDGFVITANGESKQILQAQANYQATFENLIPGETYSVDAYSFLLTPDLTSQALMDFTPVSVTTATPAPGEVTVQSITSTSITVSWGAVPASQYSVTISPLEGQRTENILSRKVDFTQLTPGRLYTITLISSSLITGELESSVMQRTAPSPPSALVVETLDADDTIGLQLSWALPTTGEWDAIKYVSKLKLSIYYSFKFFFTGKSLQITLQKEVIIDRYSNGKIES